MDQLVPQSEPATTPAPVFFWIAIGLFALLGVFGATGMWVLASEGRRVMSGAGTPGFLMGTFLLGIAELFFCAAGLSTAVSLGRREPHRRLSVAVLIVWALILSMLLLAFWARASGDAVTNQRGRFFELARGRAKVAALRSGASSARAISPGPVNGRTAQAQWTLKSWSRMF
jgi:hypothetical protein